MWKGAGGILRQMTSSWRWRSAVLQTIRGRRGERRQKRDGGRRGVGRVQAGDCQETKAARAPTGGIQEVPPAAQGSNAAFTHSSTGDPAPPRVARPPPPLAARPRAAPAHAASFPPLRPARSLPRNSCPCAPHLQQHRASLAAQPASKSAVQSNATFAGQGFVAPCHPWRAQVPRAQLGPGACQARSPTGVRAVRA